MNCLSRSASAASLALGLLGAGNPSGSITRLSSSFEVYASEQQAAIAALTHAPDTPHEWAGVIVERNARYAYTLPVTSGERDRVSYVAVLPRAFRIVALYHTHPCRADSDRFSRGDVHTAVKERLPSYIRACGARIYWFDPKWLTNDDRRRLHDLHGGVFAGKEVRTRSRCRPKGRSRCPLMRDEVILKG
jgi:uncharacterized protein DUF4329